MKVRLLYIVPRLTDPSAEQQFLLLASRLPRDRFEMHACVLSRQPRLVEHLRRLPIDVTNVPRRAVGDVSSLRLLRRRLGAPDYDLVHVWNGTQHLDCWLLAVATGRRVVVNQDQQIASGFAERCAKNWLAHRSHAVVLNFAEDVPLAHQQIISPGVDVSSPEPDSAQLVTAGRDLRAALGLRPSVQLIGVVGQLDPRQGIKDAIWSADLLKVVRDDTHLLIFGEGPHRWRMERYRRQTRTEDRVHFLGAQDPSAVIPHLACLWQPQRQASSIYAPLLAMAHGVPVVATDLPCHRQLIEDGQTGFLVASGNRAALARRTQWLLQDPSLREQVGRQSRSAMRQRFPVSAWMERYQALYAGCKSGRTGHHLLPGAKSR